MKILQIAVVLTFLLLIGGFCFFAFTDIPVQQQDVSKEISHERFSDR